MSASMFSMLLEDQPSDGCIRPLLLSLLVGSALLWFAEVAILGNYDQDGLVFEWACYGATFLSGLAVTARRRQGHPQRRPGCGVQCNQPRRCCDVGAPCVARAAPTSQRLATTPASAFGCAARDCSRSRNLMGAARALELAREAGGRPGVAEYNLVLSAAARAGLPAVAERTLQRMLREGVRPDAASFGACVHAHARTEEGGAAAAERLLRVMCEQGVEPDVVTLGAALNACAKAGEKDRAEALLRWVTSRGVVALDAVCYNSLINVAVKAADVVAAEQWLRAMLADGMVPTVVNFTTVLHAHARSGNVMAAERGMELMKSYGVVANVVSYNALIHACCKMADVERAEMWFKDMRKHGLQATVVSYSSMLDVCAKAGDWPRAECWLTAMAADGVAPNVIAFNSVIDACAKGNQPARAEAWLRRLLREDRAPGVAALPDVAVCPGVIATDRSFTAAASAFAATGDFLDVQRILSDMGRHGLHMDPFTLTVLLSAYARARPRQVQRAEAAFREYVLGGGGVTDTPLRMLRMCLGRARCTRVLKDVGVSMTRNH